MVCSDSAFYMVIRYCNDAFQPPCFLTLSFYMTPIEICRQIVEIRYFSHSLLSQITPSSSLPFLHKSKVCSAKTVESQSPYPLPARVKSMNPRSTSVLISLTRTRSPTSRPSNSRILNLKIYPFVKGPFCYFCCKNIEHYNHADDQKDGHWQWLKS